MHAYMGVKAFAGNELPSNGRLAKQNDLCRLSERVKLALTPLDRDPCADKVGQP